jgi:hypothetical protein
MSAIFKKQAESNRLFGLAKFDKQKDWANPN